MTDRHPALWRLVLLLVMIAGGSVCAQQPTHKMTAPPGAPLPPGAVRPPGSPPPPGSPGAVPAPGTIHPQVTPPPGSPEPGGEAGGKEAVRDPKRVRRYFIAAEPVEWDYAPLGKDQLREPLPPPWNTQRTYPKFRYIQYTDATFTQKAKQPEWVGSSRVDLQACKLEYSIVSPK